MIGENVHRRWKGVNRASDPRVLSVVESPRRAFATCF